MKKFIKKNKWYIFFWTFCISFYLLFTQVLLLGVVSSESMLPTYEVNDITISLKIIDTDSLKVGDVITFEHPDRSGKPEVMIKRIAAVSGDTVKIGDEEITLKDGEFYVLGDNTQNSWDSRYWDEPFIKAEDIKGKVIVCKGDFEFG